MEGEEVEGDSVEAWEKRRGTRDEGECRMKDEGEG
jgi:hypothetical protein